MSPIDSYNIRTISLSDSIESPFRFMHQMFNNGAFEELYSRK